MCRDLEFLYRSIGKPDKRHQNPTGIYTYGMNRQGGNLELHAMVLVGWGYNDGRETKESIIGGKSNETSRDLEESDEDAQEGSGEGEELNEDRKVKHYYIVMCNWGNKWGQGGFGLMEELLNIFAMGFSFS